ncbi:hypothetical protein LQV05_002637 [Cryptococcus neoformans]|nr:hypothetical protein C356_01681 [Cryptococcus neoformans var. grubii c45]OXB38534.1 hypothetical protein J007_01677 [Cryptococcus neoformans var. grubii]OXC62949.1 hypothetical protein C358_01683 [Cryptococcus neoformans var. grubii MW-RSA852]UOH79988.1 hypothetical protein LQV05_002637 [Cryptococcus neoformans]
MFGFGSSSSSQSEIEKPAPSREERKACWNSRDIYFGCLDKNKVLQAGDEVRRDTKGNVVPGGICSGERMSYENNCAKAWVDYFNKRRTLELRRLATIEAAENSGNKDAAEAWRSVGGAPKP